MKDWPALDLAEADDLVLAALDDYAPTAVEERGPGLRVFFATPAQRDVALAALLDRQLTAVAMDVSDEDWAARSQQNLEPITVGRITIVPDPRSRLSGPSPLIPDPSPLTPGPSSLIPEIAIIIEPSMGFGTGHHATTRLCLAALQAMDLRHAAVLDVGTGSGVLAIAAVRLGASRALAIDFDADAVQCAKENLALNPDALGVTFAVADLVDQALPESDVVAANLTGAVLVRSAALLLAATKPGGALVLSGILATEEAEVVAAFTTASVYRRAQEDEWVCLMMKRS